MNLGFVLWENVKRRKGAAGRGNDNTTHTHTALEGALFALIAPNSPARSHDYPIDSMPVFHHGEKGTARILHHFYLK